MEEGPRRDGAQEPGRREVIGFIALTIGGILLGILLLLYIATVGL